MNTIHCSAYSGLFDTSSGNGVILNVEISPVFLKCRMKHFVCICSCEGNSIFTLVFLYFYFSFFSSQYRKIPPIFVERLCTPQTCYACLLVLVVVYGIPEGFLCK